jgi:hypothetical protein
MKNKITIEFPNPDMAQNFMSWLADEGEELFDISYKQHNDVTWYYSSSPKQDKVDVNLHE